MDTTERDTLIAVDRNKGLTLEQLSAKYGLSLSQLSRIGAEQGAKRVVYHPCNTKEWLSCRLENGCTVRAMSAEAGVPYGTMAYWIRRYRGTLKTKSQSTLGPCLVKNWDNEEWFRDQYDIQGQGTPSIAKLLGRSVGFVCGRLERYGITIKSHKTAMAKFTKRPTQDWLEHHYVVLSWSIQQCADEFGTSFEAILEALRQYGITERSSAEQHQGALNEFFGKQHTQETRQLCAEAGARAGKEYWTTGDIEAKKELCSIASQHTWSDPERRRASSDRIVKLCQEGKCNSKSMPFTTKSGEILLMRSSWEVAIAKYLDSCPIVLEWKYEDIIIQYMDDEDVNNFLVDFWVKWIDGLDSLIESKNQHLLSQDREQAKISAMKDYCLAHGLTWCLIDSKEEAQKLLVGYRDPVEWSGLRYVVHRRYLDYGVLAHEAMVHSIMAKVCPWPGVSYGADELNHDLLRLREENLSAYRCDSGLRSTASNSGGMPGRYILTHFHP